MVDTKISEQYKLISISQDGTLDDKAKQSVLDEIARAKASKEPYTDVFITSHGWMADEQGARNQYDKWVNIMNFCGDGKAVLSENRARESRNFRPLTIGIYWPSRPLADKKVDLQSLLAEGLKTNEDSLVILIASRLASTEPARQAIRNILNSVKLNPKPPQLPKPLVDLFHLIHREQGLKTDGLNGAPGNDCDQFAPETIYELARHSKSLVGAVPDGQSYEEEKDPWSPVEKVLALMSFWQMKNRARIVGENGGHNLLHALQQQDADLKFHLSGHSFGTIVASAMLQGPLKGAHEIKPIESLFLMQGAVSHWSFCPSIKKLGKPGYFNSIIAKKKVRGPIVTTKSRWDWAVGKSYPIAASVARQVDFADPIPEYGALGYFGACGEPGFAIQAKEMDETTQDYGFQPGFIYNIDASNVICKIDGLSGAHCDIARRPVARALWEAASTP